MRVLDLFSGIGGFSLGLERAGMETVAFCEYDEKCRQVLKKHWPEVPQYNDVRELTGETLKTDGIDNIGLICGGYPCQPFSTAGRRKGEDDDRHLWPEFKRLIQEIRPTWVLCENVAGHISMGLDNVLVDLENEGYQCQTLLIPAVAVDAKHRRDRIWIVGYSEGKLSNGVNADRKSGEPHREGHEAIRKPGVTNSSNALADARHDGREKRHEKRAKQDRQGKTDSAMPCGETLADRLRAGLEGYAGYGDGGNESGRDKAGASGPITESGLPRSEPGRWLPEPGVGRVANGVSGRVDRLKQLGNAVVPQIPEMIGRAILDAEIYHAQD